MRSLLTFLTFVLFIKISVHAAEFDRISQPQNSYCSAVLKALGDAGIALPVDISGGLINPALTYSSGIAAQTEHGSIIAGYGRDSIFDKHILPIGVSYATAEGALGAYYRLLLASNDYKQHEITLNLSGQLFSKSDEQGTVDIGVNIRYENMKWGQRPPLQTISTLNKDATWSTSEFRKPDTFGLNGQMKENRCIFDLGFFQSEVWPHTDFGLSFRNLLGYAWTKENTDSIYSIDTLKSHSGTDSSIVTRYHFTNMMKNSRGWINGHRTLAVGVVYRVNAAGGSLKLSFPCDLEVIGIFDKKIKNHYVFHSGAQAQIGKYLYARLGYSRAPGIMFMTLDDLKNINIFTGGAGVTINKFSMNFFISTQSFGTSLRIDY